MTIQGYDVAGFQADHFPLTDTSNGKPIDFAIIKITEGTGFTNSRWTAQRQWARDHGLSVGFYHFLHKGNIKAQADFFLSRVALQPGDHLWCDWETNPADGLHPSDTEKNTWIRYVQEQRPAHRVGLYCNTHFWKNIDTTGFAGDGLWIATGGITAGSPPIAAPWLIHQYSTANSIDHDIAQFTDRAAMIAWAKKEETAAVALTPDDKTWLKAEIRTALKELVYSQVWEQDRMTPPPGQATESNPKWMAQSLLRYTGERADAVLAQAQANGAALTQIKTLIDGLDLDQLPAVLADKLAALRFKLEETP